MRPLVVQVTLCGGEGELQTGVCVRSHGCVTSKSLQGCLLEDLGALERGFACLLGNSKIPWKLLTEEGRDVGKMPDNKEEAGSNFLMKLNLGKWFQNTDVLWGMASDCNLNVPQTGSCHLWDLAHDGSLSHLNSEGVSCTSSFSVLTSTCK